MKRLTDTKVKRIVNDDDVLNEWIPSERHLTIDGLREFEQRQRKRIAEAQQERARVVQIKGRKA